MKKILIVAIFALISVSSFAEYISVGAVVDNAGTQKYYDSWAGRVYEKTKVHYYLESHQGTQSVFAAYKSYLAGGGEYKEGEVTLYPGCNVWLQAEVFDANPYYNIATATIYVVNDGAIR